MPSTTTACCLHTRLPVEHHSVGEVTDIEAWRGWGDILGKGGVLPGVLCAQIEPAWAGMCNKYLCACGECECVIECACTGAHMCVVVWRSNFKSVLVCG